MTGASGGPGRHGDAGARLVRQAEALGPELAARSMEIEAARRLPLDLARRLAGEGFFRMLVPRELGGHEVHARRFVEVVTTLARADAAAAWVTMIAATTASASAALDERWAQAIYGDRPDVITVGVAAPLGRAVPVDGGLVVDGRWPWASGCQVADWLTVGVVVAPPAGGAGAMSGRRPAGPPDIRLVWFPAAEVTVHDTWDASGLCGSGSNDIEVRGAFVPEGRWIAIGAARPRYRRPLYAFPIFGLLALGVSVVALGIGRGALDAVTELAGVKVPMGANRPLGERPLTQTDLARAEGGLRAAEALVTTTVDGVWARAEAGERFSLRDRADLRLAATWAAQTAADVVLSAYRLAGGTAVYRDNRLQRALRDVNTVTQHAMVQDETLHSVGRALLGHPVDNPRF